MATPAQIAANRRNSQLSSGPSSAEGKARVAQNAVSSGLFAVTDFVRPAEQPEYAAFTQAWRKQLAAAEPAEESIAIEITRAAWRLRRCALTESELDTGIDPMLNPATAPLQASIDRAHTSAFRKMLRSMAELRRLQTERHFRLATLEGDDDVPTLGLTSTQNLSKSFALDAHRQMQQRKLQELATVENIIDATLPPRAPETPASTPRPANPFHAIRTAKEQIGFVLQKSSDAPVARNAQCPCKSGEKYKRCCGRTAPPILGGLIPAARHAIQ